MATRVVLSQQSESDGKWHPIAFYLKALSAIEQNYDTYDKEMLTIICALEEWHHFLEGTRHPFEVWTDHKNLEYFCSMWKLNWRQAHWLLYLSYFDFSLHHKPGQTMGKLDVLSRRVDQGDSSRDNSNVTLLKPELFMIHALEGVTIEGSERDIVGEIWRQNMEQKWEDSIMVMVNRLKDTKANSVDSAEWKLQDGVLYYQDRIYVLNNADLWWRVLEQHHDSKIAGHPGCWKMLELMSHTYWWPCMSKFVRLYCSTCDLCLRTKPQRRAPVRELWPLPIPAERWDTISVDFMVELPESQGHDAIMVVVNSIYKCIHIIWTHTTITASRTAWLFLHHIWKLHGLPKNIVSNCRPQFMVEFMSKLYQTLGIQMSMSTAYYPQTDGQTEHINQELEQYLWLFVNQRQNDWVDLLPMAEFQYNNHIHTSAQATPFLLDTGQHPYMGFEVRNLSRVEAVNEFVSRMKSATEEVRSAIAKAKDDMAKYYNRRRTPAPEFRPGDKVFVDASDIRLDRPLEKLAHCYLGPYPVAEKVRQHTYQLQLPRLMSWLHPVFNMVKLLAAPKDPIHGRHSAPLPEPVLVDDNGNEEYEIEAVLDSWMFRWKLQYLVCWQGYRYEEHS